MAVRGTKRHRPAAEMRLEYLRLAIARLRSARHMLADGMFVDYAAAVDRLIALFEAERGGRMIEAEGQRLLRGD